MIEPFQIEIGIEIEIGTLSAILVDFLAACDDFGPDFDPDPDPDPDFDFDSDFDEYHASV